MSALYPSKLLLIILFFIFLGTYLFSQVDSSYIREYKQEFLAEAFVTTKITSLAYEYGSGKELEYKPNNPMGLGVGLSWKEFGFSFSQGLNFMRDAEKGKTKSFNLQYSYYGRRIVLDFYALKYKGFYLEEKDKVYSHYPDLKLLKIGVSGQYVFNGNKFSYRSAFNQNEKQLKSSGSFLLGADFYYNEVHSNKLFTEDSISFNTSVYQFGPNLGYAYNWIINKHYFISGSLAPGLNMSFKNSESKVSFNPTLLFRFSTGYDAEKWAINLSFLLNRVYVSYKGDKGISMNSSVFQFGFIRRFDSQTKILRSLSGLTSKKKRIKLKFI